MHSLITFLAFFFSLGSAQPAHPAYAFVPPSYAGASVGHAVPSHAELVSGHYPSASYAEAACTNCETTTDLTLAAR